MSSTVAGQIGIAVDHLRQGQLPEAAVQLESVLREQPGHPTAQFLLAVIHFRSGRVREAEQLLLSVLQTQPGFVDAAGLLAVIKRSLDETGEALKLFERCASLGQRTPDVFNQIGSCLMDLGDPVAAGAAFKQAIELDRNLSHSYFNLGLALKSAGRSYETFLTFQRAAELNPDFLDTYEEIWQQMRQLLNWKDGLPLLEEGYRRFPSSSRLMVLLGSTYGKVGRISDAEALFQRACAVDSMANQAYAHWLQEEGRFDESIPVLQAEILAKPIQGQAYYNLSTAKCFEVSGRKFSELLPPLLDDDSIGAEGKMFLHYAAAKSSEASRDYENAIRHYDSANDLAYHLYNSKFDHDFFAADAEHAALLKLYSKESIEKLRHLGSHSKRPIFIVGMIRTGTTLLDQILAAHPKVQSAGELPYWQVSAGRVNRQWMASGGSKSEIDRVASEYLGVLTETCPGAARVTDKMPTNFIHMGLMSIVFPEAKFIHIRRSPLDTCTSIYTTFLGSGTQFAYSKANIVAYYKEYMRTMEHWRRVLPPGQMVEIDYEDLVTNERDIMMDLLSLLGLDWNESVLAHDKNTGQVSTPSLWTARQPVNTASVERWRRYEPWLGELLQLRDIVHPPATTSLSHRTAVN